MEFIQKQQKTSNLVNRSRQVELQEMHNIAFLEVFFGRLSEQKWRIFTTKNETRANQEDLERKEQLLWKVLPKIGKASTWKWTRCIRNWAINISQQFAKVFQKFRKSTRLSMDFWKFREKTTCASLIVPKIMDDFSTDARFIYFLKTCKKIYFKDIWRAKRRGFVSLSPSSLLVVFLCRLFFSSPLLCPLSLSPFKTQPSHGPMAVRCAFSAHVSFPLFLPFLPHFFLVLPCSPPFPCPFPHFDPRLLLFFFAFLPFHWFSSSMKFPMFHSINRAFSFSVIFSRFLFDCFAKFDKPEVALIFMQ